MDDIDAMFSDMLQEMDLLTQVSFLSETSRILQTDKLANQYHVCLYVCLKTE